MLMSQSRCTSSTCSISLVILCLQLLIWESWSRRLLLASAKFIIDSYVKKSIIMWFVSLFPSSSTRCRKVKVRGRRHTSETSFASFGSLIAVEAWANKELTHVCVDSNIITQQSNGENRRQLDFLLQEKIKYADYTRWEKSHTLRTRELHISMPLLLLIPDPCWCSAFVIWVPTNAW